MQSTPKAQRQFVFGSDGRFGKKENDSIRFNALSEPPRQSTPGVLDSSPEAAGPIHRSHDRPARIATELLMSLQKRVATLT